LSPTDKVRFSLRGDDTVVITRVSSEHRDPMAADAPPVVNGWRLDAHDLSLHG